MIYAFEIAQMLQSVRLHAGTRRNSTMAQTSWYQELGPATGWFLCSRQYACETQNSWDACHFPTTPLRRVMPWIASPCRGYGSQLPNCSSTGFGGLYLVVVRDALTVHPSVHRGHLIRRLFLNTRTFKQLKQIICTRSNGSGFGPPNFKTSGSFASFPHQLPSILCPPAFKPSSLPALQASSLPAPPTSSPAAFNNLPAFKPSSLPVLQPCSLLHPCRPLQPSRPPFKLLFLPKLPVPASKLPAFKPPSLALLQPCSLLQPSSLPARSPFKLSCFERRRAGRLEGWKAGRLELEGWRAGGLEGWKAGGLEGWKAGRQGCKAGRLEGWKAGGRKAGGLESKAGTGGLEGWRAGRLEGLEGLEGWKAGRLEGWKAGKLELEGWGAGGLEGWTAGRQGCKAGMLEGWKAGRLEGGRLEGWKAARLEGWRAGRLKGWKLELESCKAGRLEGWRAEGWKAGGLEGWRAGRLEGWRAGLGGLESWSWKAGGLGVQEGSRYLNFRV